MNADKISTSMPEGLARLIIEYMEDYGGGPITISKLMIEFHSPRENIIDQLVLLQRVKIIQMKLDRINKIRYYKLRKNGFPKYILSNLKVIEIILNKSNNLTLDELNRCIIGKKISDREFQKIKNHIEKLNDK